MGKSKKRNRTRALLEAATVAAAKRRLESPFEMKNTPTRATQKVLSASSVTVEESSAANRESTRDETPSPDEIATTIRTVKYLAANLDVFLHSKEFKGLRGALHPLVTERLKSYDKGIDYRTKVTAHLSHQRWSAALSALEAAKNFRQIPKQGTVQRWVRDVDGCELPAIKIQLLTSILSSSETPITNGVENNGNAVDDDGNGERDEESSRHINKHDPALALIEAQKDYEALNNSKGDKSENDATSGMRILGGWRIPSSTATIEVGKNDSVQNLSALKSRVVYQEAGAERTPPNHFDLILHATDSFAVLPLKLPTPTTPEVIKHNVPFVKTAFVLENVLTSLECRRLVEAASLLGYRPDHPMALSRPTGIDSCEWLVDDSVHDLIYDRVKDLLPSQTANAELCGINRRWRFFRYGQGCVYRPHIDGSWPAGFLSKDGKSYERDEKGATRSYWTFLIYLNDDFEGGETKFYFPANDARNSSSASSLVARGVIPKKGSVLVFPQGNTASLLHEGSAVTKGTKYVVRTDVIYKLE